MEITGLSGYLSVIIEYRLIIRGLRSKCRIGLCLDSALCHGCKGLCGLDGLLRSCLLVAESRLE